MKIFKRNEFFCFAATEKKEKSIFNENKIYDDPKYCTNLLCHEYCPFFDDKYEICMRFDQKIQYHINGLNSNYLKCDECKNK